MNNNAITITYFDTMRFRIAAVAIDCGGHDVLVFLIFFASFTNLNSVSRRFKNAKWFLNFYRKYFFYFGHEYQCYKENLLRADEI